MWLSDRVYRNVTTVLKEKEKKFKKFFFFFLLVKKRKEFENKKKTNYLCVTDVEGEKKERKIMWSDVMVSLSSSVPVVKMEGLVKLCAESLHFVLLGLCTR